MKYITARMLRMLGACESQVTVFEDEWPKGAEITVANCIRAGQLCLNVDWLITSGCRSQALEAYEAATAPALATYEAATAPARATYEAARAQARSDYEAAKVPALTTPGAAIAPVEVAYNAAIAQARATYEAAIDPVQATYDAAIAPAQVVALESMEFPKEAKHESSNARRMG